MKKFQVTVAIAFGILMLCGSCKPREGSVADIDGNVYRTVFIGAQEWMAENLRTTRYRSGLEIPHPTVNDELVNATSGTWANYDYDAANDETYGKLYNWYAVTASEGLCPEGWHAPSEQEWSKMIEYLGGMDDAACKLKEKGTGYWDAPNTCANNRSGFTGLPGGYHDPTGFVNLGKYGIFWSTGETEDVGVFYSLWYNEASVFKLTQTKSNMISVRCLSNE